MIEVHGAYIHDYREFFTRTSDVTPAEAYGLLKDCLTKTGEDLRDLQKDLESFQRVGMNNKCFRGYRKVGDTLYFLYNHDQRWAIWTTTLDGYEKFLANRKSIGLGNHHMPPFPDWKDETGEKFEIWNSPTVIAEKAKKKPKNP